MRRLVVLLSTIVALDITFFTALVPLLPHFVSSYGLSKGSAGVLSAAYAAGVLLRLCRAGWSRLVSARSALRSSGYRSPPSRALSLRSPTMRGPWGRPGSYKGLAARSLGRERSRGSSPRPHATVVAR